MRVYYALILFLFVVLPCFAGEKSIDKQDAIVMTEQERKEWGQLKSKSEKETWVEAFWKKRDPDPSTGKNEFREELERRQKYLEPAIDSTLKYWETDLGKTFLLLGQPTAQDTGKMSIPVQKRVFEEGIGYKEIRVMADVPFQKWTYRGLPAPIAEGEIQIVFVGNIETRAFDFKDRPSSEELLERARVHWSHLAERASEKAGSTSQQ